MLFVPPTSWVCALIPVLVDRPGMRIARLWWLRPTGMASTTSFDMTRCSTAFWTSTLARAPCSEDRVRRPTATQSGSVPACLLLPRVYSAANQSIDRSFGRPSRQGLWAPPTQCQRQIWTPPRLGEHADSALDTLP